MKLLLTPAEALHHDQVGPKAQQQAALFQADFPVPAFVVLPAELAHLIYLGDQGMLEDALAEVRSTLPASVYAVRSAALNEDTQESSMAGQFHTETMVLPDDLPEALRAVLSQAAEVLAGTAAQCSVMFQQYIPADYAGVAFTRSPTGGREMVVEYHRGAGEKLVAGEVKPERVAFYWSQSIPAVPIPDFARGAGLFRDIEQSAGAPQDVEWCVQGKEWYIIQARPITTLTAEQYAAQQYLDDHVPKQPFYWHKTALSEIAPRPTPLTLSLLQRIYGPGGPAQLAYRRFGLQYRALEIIHIVGTELFVDREAECRTLLPSFGYTGTSAKPSLKRFSGIIRSMRNMLAWQKVDPEKQVEQLHREVSEALLKPTTGAKPADVVAQCMHEYVTVVAVNIVAMTAMGRLESMLRRMKLHPAALLASPPDCIPELSAPTLPEASAQWLGNGLEIADQYPFYQSIAAEPPPTSFWWELSEKQRDRLEPVLRAACQTARLREFGRWLTVKLVNELRSALASSATNLQADSLSMVTIEEWSGNVPNAVALAERQQLYQQGELLSFPSVLTGAYRPAESLFQGVSPGTAQGTVVTVETINEAQGSKILWHPTLSPDLTQYFNEVDGIATETGGLLSHLAIVARERGIPVVVGVPKPGLGVKVEMDGAEGTWR